MGWAAILVPEAYGGLDFGHVGMGQIIKTNIFEMVQLLKLCKNYAQHFQNTEQLQLVMLQD